MKQLARTGPNPSLNLVDTSYRLIDATTGRPIGGPLPGSALGGGVIVLREASVSADGKTASFEWHNAMGQHCVAAADLATGKLLAGARTVDPQQAVRLVPDGRRAIFSPSFSSGRIAVVDLVEGRETEGELGRADDVHGIALRPDGKAVALLRGEKSTGARTIDVLDPATGSRIGDSLKQPSEITSAAFDPEGRVLATGGADHVVRFWDVSGSGPRAGRSLWAKGSPRRSGRSAREGGES